MAAIDYTTLVVDGKGRMVERLEIVPSLNADAYKGTLILEEGDRNVHVSACTPLDDIKGIPSFKGGRDIVLEDDTKDMGLTWWKAGVLAKALEKSGLVKEHGRKLRKILRKGLVKCDKGEDGLLRILRFEEAGRTGTVFLFPDSPHFGGMTCAYVLDDEDRVSMILSGYGHYCNPALHWIGRSLSESAEAEIAGEEYNEMVCTNTLLRLIAPLAYDSHAYERCGSGMQIGLYGDEKMMKDADFDRLYQAVKKAARIS